MIKVCNEKELTPALQKKAEDLFAACAAYEGLTLSAPDLIAPEERVYLYLDDEDPSRLNAFLVTYDNGDYYEMTAFTRPECRQKGYFTKLFDRLISEIGEEAALCIYTDGCSYDAFATLEFFLGAQYTSTEHLMTLDLSKYPEKHPSGDTALEDSSDIALLSRIHSRAFDVKQKESRDYLRQAVSDGSVLWEITSAGKPCGLCLGTAGEDEVYLFGLAIDPDFQGKGIGTQAMDLLLSSLKGNYKTVKIQVSEEDAAAYALYCHEGFQTAQELQEYWY